MIKWLLVPLVLGVALVLPLRASPAVEAQGYIWDCIATSTQQTPIDGATQTVRGAVFYTPHEIYVDHFSFAYRKLTGGSINWTPRIMQNATFSSSGTTAVWSGTAFSWQDLPDGIGIQNIIVDEVLPGGSYYSFEIRTTSGQAANANRMIYRNTDGPATCMGAQGIARTPPGSYSWRTDEEMYAFSVFGASTIQAEATPEPVYDTPSSIADIVGPGVVDNPDGGVVCLGIGTGVAALAGYALVGGLGGLAAGIALGFIVLTLIGCTPSWVLLAALPLLLIGLYARYALGGGRS